MMSDTRKRLGDWLDRNRFGLASGRADGFLAILGLVSGVCAGFIIVGFRLSVTALQQLHMPGLPGDSFESLDPLTRFAVPTAGGLLIGIGFWLLAAPARTVGIVHVLERLHYHQGHMPLRNLLVQFVGGAVALASGHSVGREAPSVHLGAAFASIFGRRLTLPNNAIRTLIACGAAAAIAASFNTPLAGVVFAMEVIMVEYTIAGFVPVILAAVAATAVTRAVFGGESVFYVPLLGITSLWDLVYIVLMGVLIGTISATFVRAVRSLSRRMALLPIALPPIVAGLIVGVLASVAPEVLGLGYDTVARALSGEILLVAALGIMLAKFVASVTCIAARVPGGLIGPTVVMGSLAGSGFAALVAGLPGESAQAPLFAMLGMGALMAAVLQAPLAALLALLEMTGNPLIILPAMLAVVAASLTAKIAFGQESVFTHLMRDGGLDYHHDPVSQGLRRVGVTAIMNRNFVQCSRRMTQTEARQVLESQPQWLLFEPDEQEFQLLRAADLALFVESAESGESPDESVDLLAIPGTRFELAAVHLQATLHEAREIIMREGVEALYVQRPLAPMRFRTFGVVFRADVEAGYRLGP